MEQTTKRRSRMHRQPTNGRVMLRPRDIDILRALWLYRYLRSSHLYALIGGNRHAFIRRLGTLYHEFGYLNRPARQWQAVNARYMPAVYELTDTGENVLRDHGRATEESPLLHRGRGNGFLFQHELMISDILSSVEIGVRERPELKFVPWPTILRLAPEATKAAERPFDLPCSIAYRFERGHETCNRALEPDAIFGIKFPGDGARSFSFYALEADRNSEPMRRPDFKETSWLRKLLQYLDVFDRQTYDRHLGLPNLKLLVVTTDEGQMRRIMQLLEELTDGKGHPHILFLTMPSLASLEKAPSPTPFILDTAWKRVGYPDFIIDKKRDASASLVA